MVECESSFNPYSAAISLKTGIPFLFSPWLMYNKFSLVFVCKNSGANINILPSIVINIYYSNTSAPPVFAIHLCGIRNILKFEIPFIQI